MDKSRIPIQAGTVSPIINETFAYRKLLLPPKQLVIWGCFNLTAAILLLSEVVFKHVQCWFAFENDLVNICLTLSAGIFIINAILNFSQAANTSMSPCPIPLSPIQKKLMGLSEKTVCQSTPAHELSTKSASSTSPQTYNLSTFTSPGSAPSSTQFSHQSGSLSMFETSNSISPTSYFKNHSPHHHPRHSIFNASGDMMHLHHRRSTFLNMPLHEEEFMTEQKTLNSYLKSYFETNQTKLQLYANEITQGQGWTPSFYVSDNSVDLSQTAYQLSTRSPKSPTRNIVRKEDAAKVAASEYWINAGVSDDSLKEWMANLRRWLSLVILRGLVKKIDEMNKLLKFCGCIEVQIGNTSLNALKKVQINRGCQSGLAYLLPYLELTTNQEYLVERICCLATGGYMSEFKWNKGGSMKNGREWSDDLITDCELIMHMFCIYFDNHLPPDPRFPNGKTFSSQFFVKTPDKPKMSNIEDKMIIYQSQLHPPHYVLVTKELTFDLPSGHHNMLGSLLLFLHYLKYKQSSMLGQVNLGLSGIDILYIIEPIEQNLNDSISSVI